MADPTIVPGDAPPLESPSFGHLRCRVLDGLVTGRFATIPEGAAAALRGMTDHLAQLNLGDPRGVDADDPPEAWRSLLAWAGMPFSTPGTHLWGSALIPDPSQQTPRLDHAGALRLPLRERWDALTGISLKPVRAFVHQHFGWRLQAAPGIRLWLWTRAGIVVSTATLPLGGFLHGPTPGHRATLALPPGGYQIVQLT